MVREQDRQPGTQSPHPGTSSIFFMVHIMLMNLSRTQFTQFKKLVRKV